MTKRNRFDPRPRTSKRTEDEENQAKEDKEARETPSYWQRTPLATVNGVCPQCGGARGKAICNQRYEEGIRQDGKRSVDVVKVYRCTQCSKLFHDWVG